LAQAAQKLGEEMQKAQQAQGAAPGGNSGGEAKSDTAKKDDGNVVDAEFEEVKDGKK
jgi:molecular chaperone DnaK